MFNGGYLNRDYSSFSKPQCQIYSKFGHTVNIFYYFTGHFLSYSSSLMGSQFNNSGFHGSQQWNQPFNGS